MCRPCAADRDGGCCDWRAASLSWVDRGRGTVRRLSVPLIPTRRWVPGVGASNSGFPRSTEHLSGFEGRKWLLVGCCTEVRHWRNIAIRRYLKTTDKSVS